MKTFFQSILAAAIGGAATAAGLVITSPANFVFSISEWEHVAKVALIGGIIPVLALLKKSPLSPKE